MRAGPSTSLPRFVFSLSRLRANAQAFKDICDQTLSSCGYNAYFPIKVTPSAPILEVLREIGFGLEAINPQTAMMAQQFAGAPMILGGPAKTDVLIAYRQSYPAWTHISCESLTDLKHANAAAVRYGYRFDVLLRLKATLRRRLGMSLEDARWSVDHAREFSGLRIAGLHIHSGSNLTDREADLTLERMRTAAVDLSRRGLGVAHLNFGGGFPCIDGNEMEIQRRLEGCRQLANMLGAQVILEPGRALVGDAAKLVAEITDVRPTDKEITINTAAYVIHGPCNADKFIIHRRCDSQRERRYEVKKRKDGNYRVGGIWPAEGDSIWLDVPAPDFTIGDKIIFPQAGAYALGFLSELAFDELTPVMAIEGPLNDL